jgi:hypothetical protein
MDQHGGGPAGSSKKPVVGGFLTALHCKAVPSILGRHAEHGERNGQGRRDSASALPCRWPGLCWTSNVNSPSCSSYLAF